MTHRHAAHIATESAAGLCKRARHIAPLLIATALLGACSDPAKEQGKAALAYWENKCKTVAGEKVYRKVEGVEGILLLKVRPKASDPEWYDRNFPGAAFARERQADGYIESFLGYEHSSAPDGKRPISPTDRGYINIDFLPQNPNNEPGYRYVDVIDEKDGARYRYSGRWEEPWLQDKSWLKGYIKFYLDRVPAPDPAPRYAVTFEDHVIPEERALGVAAPSKSSTPKPTRCSPNARSTR